MAMHRGSRKNSTLIKLRTAAVATLSALILGGCAASIGTGSSGGSMGGGSSGGGMSIPGGGSSGGGSSGGIRWRIFRWWNAWRLVRWWFVRRRIFRWWNAWRLVRWWIVRRRIFRWWNAWWLVRWRFIRWRIFRRWNAGRLVRWRNVGWLVQAVVHPAAVAVRQMVARAAEAAAEVAVRFAVSVVPYRVPAVQAEAVQAVQVMAAAAAAGGDMAGTNCDPAGNGGWGGPDAECDGSVGQYPGESEADRKARLERTLEESVGGFDEVLAEEQREISTVGRNTEGFGNGADGGGTGRVGLGSQGSGGSGGGGGGGGGGAGAAGSVVGPQEPKEASVGGLTEEEIQARTPGRYPGSRQ